MSKPTNKVRTASEPSLLGNKSRDQSPAIPASFVVLEPRIILDAAGSTTAFALTDGDAEFGSPREPVHDHQAADPSVDDLRDAISVLAASESGTIAPASSDPEGGVSAAHFGADAAELSSFYILHGDNSEHALQLADAMVDATRRIVDYLGGGDGLDRLYHLFPGSTVDRTAEWDDVAAGVLHDILSGNLELRLEIRESSDLLGAYAAFAASGPDGHPVIYLNAAWLQHLSEDQISALIIEETGHWIDNALNRGQDSAGDEGELFAAYVLDLNISDEQWSRIKTESDTVRIEIDGVMVELELAALLFSNSAYFVQTSSSVPTTQLETSAVYTTALVGGATSRYLFVSNPPTDPVFSGNNTQGYLYVVSPSNEVTAFYFGEVTRLFKNGSAVIGLQFFVYPDGYKPGSGDRQTPSDTSILIDLGANFVLNQTYKTSSDPVAGALNALLPSGGELTANPDTDSIQLPSCSESVSVNQSATGNVLTGAGTDGNLDGADTSANTTYVVTLTDPAAGNGTFAEVQEPLIVTSATSTATGASAAVVAGADSTVAGAFGTLSIGANGSYTYTVNATLPALVALRAGETVTEVFTYSVADTKGLTSTTTLTITINGGNDAPTAANDYQFVREGTATLGTTLLTTTTTSGGLLLNDQDPDTGDTFKITRAEKADALTDETFLNPIAVTDVGATSFDRTIDFTYNSVAQTSNWGGSTGQAVFISRDGSTWTNTGLFVNVVLNGGATKTMTFKTVEGATTTAVASELGYLDFKATDRLSFGTQGTSIGTVASVSGPSASIFLLQSTGTVPSVNARVSGEGIQPDSTVTNVRSLTIAGVSYT